jgi:DNA-binding HxlR family transcriptional regulator
MNTKACTDCPIARVAKLLSDPWTMLIIRDLLKKSLRFSDLMHSLDGISSRTLTLKLNKLIEEEIVVKKDFQYSITKQGKKLESVLKAMSKYGASVK